MNWLCSWLVLGLLVGTLVEGSDDGDVDPLLVKVEQGLLKGKTKLSSEEREFRAFMGIPYAKPPLGDLRFKDPVEPESWEGVRDATRAAPVCLQGNPFQSITGLLGEMIGDESCLYLDVYSPKENSDEGLLPVMVFIHGGGYIMGSATEYNPDIFMNEDVVLVIIQYRLGTLGFLSTEDEAASGNQGLKDQTLALHWVQRNIAQFGGNPLLVTIFGESAGAASVHLQILSHKSLGLFNRAILQSGSAMCPWAVSTNHREVAYYVGEILGCSSIIHDDESEIRGKNSSTGDDETVPDRLTSEKLIDCLRKLPATDVASTYAAFMRWGFLPVMLAPRVSSDFLMADPNFLMKEARHKRLDLMTGITRDDGAFFVYPMFSNEAMRSSLRFNFKEIGPILLEMSEGDIAPLNQSLHIFDHYLGSLNITPETSDKITAMLTDRFFAVGNDLTAEYYSRNVAGKKKHVYMYELKHKGKRSFGDIFNLTFGKHWIPHTDDLIYLFSGESGFLFKMAEEDKGFSKLMTRLWVNFAKTGNPTPDDSLGFTWDSVVAGNLQHLALTTKPYMEANTRGEVREFWSSLPLKQNMILFPDKVKNLKADAVYSETTQHKTEL